jgi:hypothetical protein
MNAVMRGIVNLIGFLLLVVAAGVALFLVGGAFGGSLTAAQAVVGVAAVAGLGWLSFRFKV